MKLLFNLISISSIILFNSLDCFSQMSGTITYTHKMELEIDKEAIPEEFRDLVPSFKEGETILTFKNNESTFAKVESHNHDKSFSSENSLVEISFSSIEEESTLYVDHNSKLLINQTGFMGKRFLVKGEIKEYSWKISNEKVKYLDYECIKATTINEDGELITAWFTPQIAQKIGPEGFGQLPGAILMLSVGDNKIEYKATKIILEEVEIIIPKKGKKITSKEFEKIKENKVKEMEEEYNDSNNIMIIRG